MSTLKEIQRTIDRFFPKGVKPDGDDYLNSKEYQNLMLKKEEVILQTHFSKKLSNVFPEYVVSDWTNLPFTVGDILL